MSLLKQYAAWFLDTWQWGFFGEADHGHAWQAKVREILVYSGLMYVGDYSGDNEVSKGRVLPRETIDLEPITIIFIGLINERFVAANSSIESMLLKPTVGEEILPMMRVILHTYEKPMLFVLQDCSLIFERSVDQKWSSRNRQIVEFYFSLKGLIRGSQACVIVTEVPEVTELLAQSNKKTF